MTQEQSPSSAAIEREPLEVESPAAATKPGSFRFGLRSLFAAVTIVAAFCGAIHFAGIGGAFGVAAVLCLVAGVQGIKKSWPMAITLMMPAAFLFAVFAFLAPAVENAREAANHSSCQGRLKQLSHAILNYEDMNRSLPPVFTVGPKGEPFHSWRTLLLRYLEEDAIFQRLKLEEPWDSTHNRVLSQLAIDQFRCDSDRNQPQHTSYVAVVGPDTVWRAGNGVQLNEIKDGPANTILLVEMKNSGITWSEPRDLDLDQIPAVKKKDLIRFLSNHDRGLNVAFCDGHIETLPPTIPLDQFEALLTKSGREIIDRSRW